MEDPSPDDVQQLAAAPAEAAAVASRVRHGGFVAGAECFDSGAFGVAPAEAGAMDPQQRLLLERGYAALHGAALLRAALLGSLTGVFVGIGASDYAELLRRSPAGSSVYGATGSAHSIASGRLAYVLGLHGPCVSYDTSCSAALVAAHAGLRSLQLGECATGLAAAVNAMLLPGVGWSFAAAGMTSALGRSHTFDERADGYARSEACGAVVLRDEASSSASAAAFLRGSCTRQDGKSASLTAPNGLAQAALLAAALADGAVASTDLTCAEAHGTGTALGDPIEARSLVSALVAPRQPGPPLAVGGVKANAGHAEPAAGLAGLLKLVVLLPRDASAPNAQLRVLNAHVEAAVSRAACALQVQCGRVAPGSPSSRAGGVSSFGYNGTIAHAILGSLAAASSAAAAARSSAPSSRRRRFAWREAAHPLLQRRVQEGGEGAAFRSAVAGALLALVGDHVVHGRVVFPAAGYLEMARGACSASLEGATFVRPLVLADGEAVEQQWVECALGEGHLVVRSFAAEEALERDEAAVHFSAAVSRTGRAFGGASQPLLRSRTAVVVGSAALYASFGASGLEYGAAHRTLEVAWAARGGGAGATALARLRRRRDRQGTRVHPADLDGALQLPLVLVRAGAAQTWLPFAVGAASLAEGIGELRAAAERLGGDGSSVWLRSAQQPAAQLDGLQSRPLQSGVAAAVGLAQQLYVTAWVGLAVAAPARSALLALETAGRVALEPAVEGSPRAAAVPRTQSGLLVALGGVRDGVLSSLSLLECAVALLLAQHASERCAVWLLTCGSEPTRASQPAHAGLWGAARASRQESPLSLLSCVDAAAAVGAATAAGSRLPFAAGGDEREAVAEGRLLHAPRLERAALSLSGPVRLHLSARGALANLRVEAQPQWSSEVAEGEVELRVRAVGLNFRDVLNVLGEYPGDAGAPGGDFAGRVCGGSSGARVAAAGTEACGVAHAALASFARAAAWLVAPKAAALSLEQACTLPTAWSTVLAAFSLAALGHAHGVLLHAGAGGVGLTALECALWLRARACATAGGPAKHAWLRGIGVVCACSSRDGAALGAASALLLSGRMHAVLNSLSGDFASASLALLREGGSLEEMGKRGVWSSARTSAAAAQARRDVLALDTTMAREPTWMRRALALLYSRAAARVLHGLPLRRFVLERAVAAFRCLQSGRSVGKVVVCVAAGGGGAPACAGSAELLSGGTGSLGLLTARWLAQCGAGVVVLASRSGVADGRVVCSAPSCAAWLARCDIGEPCDVRRLLLVASGAAGARAPVPVGGVWHAAGVLSDGVLAQQGSASLRRVYAAKVLGCRTRPTIKF